jgi:hypothetical protein
MNLRSQVADSGLRVACASASGEGRLRTADTRSTDGPHVALRSRDADRSARRGPPSTDVAAVEVRVREPGRENPGTRDAEIGSIELGGSVEVFLDEADARRKHSSVRGPVLLRLPRRLTPEQAAEYEAGR